MKSYFKTGSTLKKLNDKLKLVELIAIGYINSLFVNGIDLPIPEKVTGFLNDPRARHFDGYLFLDAEPDFTALNPFEKLENHKNSTIVELPDADDQIDENKLLTF